ncbi:MAG: YbbR-like domain-containing protein [Ruminococcus sp.]|jgi:YbbR domain-containing protein
MKKKITNNLLLKILSLAIAFLVWLLVANINDPIVVTSYDVPVTIQNSAYLESGGKTYQVLEEQQTVTVILRGNRSVVENRQSDIQAIADLTQIVDMNTTPVMVPVTATCDRVEQENITVVPAAIGIDIEDMVSKDFTITVTPAGDSTPGKDYEVGSMTSDPEKVTITGPESLINKIDRVMAEVDTSLLEEDTTKTCRLEIYDKNQENLSDTEMSYLKFDIGEPVVDVHIDLWRVRDEVELSVGYSGSPAEGYQVGEVAIVPSTISVAGTDEALSQLAANGNKIEISPDAVVLDGQDSDVEVRLTLSDYMPQDLVVANNVETAIVNVSIIPLGSQEYKMATRDITIQNLDDKLRLVFDTDSVTLRVQESGGDISTLTANDISLSVNMDGREEGDYEVELNVKLPEGFELVEPVKTLVHVSELE